MMKKLLAMLLTGAFACSIPSTVAMAADDRPPAQQQKNQIPDTPQNGNYLEPQQDHNGGADATQQQQGSQRKSTSSPGNIEKSKRFQQKPQDGGTGVNNQ
ncbi:hypothetical protein [Methylophilus aquaticus]|uniref:Lipoprotein n=1 Tax=Methylophilus aquaticus TaxID=1971610 RepID=A0ABT9JRV2_9PROT|nr:hypothetical protein [Methylophilus aquaticus]MDP8567300.1 hypothetical protein [Methylophilus aquaticus]